MEETSDAEMLVGSELGLIQIHVGNSSKGAMAMVGASVLGGTRSVEISDLVTHDFFPKKSVMELLRHFMLKRWAI